jgi:hypothetical protein
MIQKGDNFRLVEGEAAQASLDAFWGRMETEGHIRPAQGRVHQPEGRQILAETMQRGLRDSLIRKAIERGNKRETICARFRITYQTLDHIMRRAAYEAEYVG